MEHRICETPELSKLDETMATLYKSAVTLDTSQRQHQREWLKNERTVNKSDAELIATYQKRNAALVRVVTGEEKEQDINSPNANTASINIERKTDNEVASTLPSTSKTATVIETIDSPVDNNSTQLLPESDKPLTTADNTKETVTRKYDLRHLEYANQIVIAENCNKHISITFFWTKKVSNLTSEVKRKSWYSSDAMKIAYRDAQDASENNVSYSFCLNLKETEEFNQRF